MKNFSLYTVLGVATLLLASCGEPSVTVPVGGIAKVDLSQGTSAGNGRLLYARNLDGGDTCIVRYDSRLAVDAFLDIVHEDDYRRDVGFFERFEFNPKGNFKCRDGVPFSGPGELRMAVSVKQIGSENWASPRYAEISSYWNNGMAEGFAALDSQTKPFGKSGVMGRSSATVLIPANSNEPARRPASGEKNRYSNQTGTRSDFFDYLLAIRQSNVAEFTQGLTAQFDILTELVPTGQSNLDVGNSLVGANNQFLGASLQYDISPKNTADLPATIVARANFRVVFSYDLAGFNGLAGRNETEVVEVPVTLSASNGYRATGQIPLSDVLTIQDASLGVIGFRQLLDGVSIISSLQQ